ncbi:ACP S-malonyltransferase [Mobilitalea sibirica]|uniref:Malonyl CoA-acyl carrier protein transacylase n=1 Tax=Mobilitalea sibirica TaxID=1462919 RepID=A0A8J7H194_9FIRM|nr:ACP S-malonyltransferase [Mobilitalea sibirica]MBH1940067.1 ACP S-malonyltransferase [Mobilitalea sibirica]
MGKTAFLFAGQGAQYIGMGKELYDNFPICKQVFEEASSSLDMDLIGLIFNGTKEELNLTENTQPAIVTMSIAAYRAFNQIGITPDVVAGLSLGEYSALTASGVFSLSQVIPLVRKRGRFMQEAVPEGIGKMNAILGLAEDKVREACEEAKALGIVEPANFNCPGQIVIGGEVKAVDEAARIAKEKGAMKTLDLPVSAPFHTSMLKPAADRLKTELEHLEIGEMNIPVMSNVTADYITGSKDVKDLLYRQVMSSVLWEQIIRTMIRDGVTNFVEIGPGKTLSGFVKKIDRSLRILNVEDVASLEAAASALKTEQ